MPLVRSRNHTIRYSKDDIRGLTIKFVNLELRGIVHYEFVPTGQSTKFTIWKY